MLSINFTRPNWKKDVREMIEAAKLRPLTFLLVRMMQCALMILFTVPMMLFAADPNPNRYQPWIYQLFSLLTVGSLVIGWMSSLDRWRSCIIDPLIIAGLIATVSFSVAMVIPPLVLIFTKLGTNWPWLLLIALFHMINVGLIGREFMIYHASSRLTVDAVIDSET